MLSATAILAILATLAVATTTSASQCNTGPVQCCQEVRPSNDPKVQTLLALLGITIFGAVVPIGITCTPITAAGVGGASCSAQPVCCQNNNFNGIVAIGCTPIVLNL